jgi:hypothetical protein
MHLRRVMHFHGDPTEYYLHLAMPIREQRIEDFNDDRRSYDGIRTVILRAREFAARRSRPSAARRGFVPDALT